MDVCAYYREWQMFGVGNEGLSGAIGDVFFSLYCHCGVAAAHSTWDAIVGSVVEYTDVNASWF